jgi:SAM-dependent methyltransferase
MKPYADHFSRLATAYASRRPSYPDELFAYLGAISRRHEVAWDCAAGNGQASVPLARIFRRVIATDASASMIANATPHSGVEYRVASAEASGLSSASVDLVTVAQALHWLDVDLFYTVVNRVLVPGGLLAVWTYGSQYLGDEGLDRVLGRFYSELVGPYWPRERCHVESGYRTLRFPYVELDPPSFAMEEEWNLAELLGYIGTWSATQRFRETLGRDPLDQLAGEIAPLWGDPASTRRIRWPLSLRVGRPPT